MEKISNYLKIVVENSKIDCYHFEQGFEMLKFGGLLNLMGSVFKLFYFSLDIFI